MAKHIHIWMGQTRDADGPAHVPAGSSKGGQFTSGSGGSGSAAKKATGKGPALREKALPGEVDKHGKPVGGASPAGHEARMLAEAKAREGSGTGSAAAKKGEQPIHRNRERRE